MSLAGLSFNALPPIRLPFRFFITAPIFILLCTGLIAYSGPDLWLGRWQPPMLALVHGFTLGFLTMVMLGALLQLLPVIAGIGIPHPELLAPLTHGLLSVGTLMLLWGFLQFHSSFILAAMLLIALGLGNDRRNIIENKLILSLSSSSRDIRLHSINRVPIGW